MLGLHSVLMILHKQIESVTLNTMFSIVFLLEGFLKRNNVTLMNVAYNKCNLFKSIHGKGIYLPPKRD